MGKLCFSLAHQKKWGVVLYIKETIKAKSIYADEEGRILMVEVIINHIQVLLTVIYAKQQTRFLLETPGENHRIRLRKHLLTYRDLQTGNFKTCGLQLPEFLSQV
uniref:Uncharacterized protein n=1 Tax=Micrurus paraensis TaxID=1970185 RepID=A0A2D4KY60_9SAUR